MANPHDRPEPLGFGNCRKCPYVGTGPIATCYACASARMRSPDDTSCPICRQDLPIPGIPCRNDLCHSPTRAFEWAAVIGVKAGILEQTIWDLKDGIRGWAWIHARIVLGFLYDHPELVDAVDAIIPMPAMAATVNGELDHARLVVQKAKEQDERGLPFVLDPPLIQKVLVTRRMRETRSIWERSEIGEQLLEALRVPNPNRVRGLRVMVYDDVFTSGTTLNSVARTLKAAGASRVYGLALSRQPWSH